MDVHVPVYLAICVIWSKTRSSTFLLFVSKFWSMSFPPRTIRILLDEGHGALKQQVTLFLSTRSTVMMCLYLFYQRTELGWAFSLGMKHNLYLFIRQTSSLSLLSPPSSSLRASKTWIGACICSDIYSEILSFHHNLKFDLLDAFHLIKLYSITASRYNQYAWHLWLGSFLSISVIHSKRGSESDRKIIIHHSAWLQLISFYLNCATEQVRKKVYGPYFLALVNKSNTMLW